MKSILGLSEAASAQRGIDAKSARTKQPLVKVKDFMKLSIS
jgi:hypothetical protein